MVAPAWGMVLAVISGMLSDHDGYGHQAVIQHPGGVRSLLGHFSDDPAYPIVVQRADVVQAGQLLG